MSARNQSVQVARELPVWREVAGHHAAAPFLLTQEMFGGLPFDLASAELSELVDRPIAELHEHDSAEIYVLLSAQPGEAEIEIELPDGPVRLTSPAALLVPARTKHRFVTRRAAPGCFCLGLLLSNELPIKTHT